MEKSHQATSNNEVSPTFNGDYTKWKEHMRSLKGEIVEVVYSENPRLTIKGRLEDYDDEGQVDILKDHQMYYVWPCLDIRKATDV